MTPPLQKPELDVFTIAMASLMPDRGRFHTTCAATLKEHHDLARRKTLSEMPANGIDAKLQRRRQYALNGLFFNPNPTQRLEPVH
jgi:hypothetical protein